MILIRKSCFHFASCRISASNASNEKPSATTRWVASSLAFWRGSPRRHGEAAGGEQILAKEIEIKVLTGVDYGCSHWVDYACKPIPMNKHPKISDTEWELMRVVWAKHPITAAEIIEQLNANDPSWHPKTARTLLARLVEKKALDYEAQGRSYVYNPLVSESECVAAASESFVSRVFGGSLRPLLAHFVERQKLTGQDLEELRRLLDERRSEKHRASRRGHGKH